MRIVYLVESAAQIWGGVKVVLDDANLLTERGHEVEVICGSEPPTWTELRCGFRTVSSFAPEHIPDADLVVATFWTTVPFAVECGRGVPVHFCQGYEGDNPENVAHRARIEAVYRLEEARKIAIAPHLVELIGSKFGQQADLVPNGIDHRVMFPDEVRPRDGRRVRVGLVGPYEIAWKDIRTGIEACALSAAAGLDLELVRVTNTAPHPDEKDLPFPVEWHVQVPPAHMGELYRSLDVLLATSYGPEEGFFLPAIEAMACGVPCVMTEVPCFTGYAPDERPPYALFVEARDPKEMAEALVLTAKHPGLYGPLREAGIEVAGRYTQERHIDELERAFAEISGKPRSVPTPIEVSVPAATLAKRPDKLTELSEGILSSLVRIGETYQSAARYDEAVTHLEAAQCLRADDPALTARLANARYLAGDDAGALADFERALAASSGDADLHADHGMVLFSIGRTQDAANSFAAAIRCGRRTAENYNNLGVALHRTGDDEGAISAFREALAVDADHEEARANLADLSVTAHP